MGNHDTAIPNTPVARCWYHRRVSETLIGGGKWRVDYAFELQGGATVIAGVMVTPASDDRSWPPEPGSAPPGGLTARVLRGIPMGPELIASKAAPGIRVQIEEAGRIVGDSWSTPPPRRPGSSGRSDTYYLPFVRLAVRAADSGSASPVADAAEQLGFDRDYVRDQLHAARRRGLLTKPPRGRGVGQLTDKARRLLEPVALA